VTDKLWVWPESGIAMRPYFGAFHLAFRLKHQFESTLLRLTSHDVISQSPHQPLPSRQQHCIHPRDIVVERACGLGRAINLPDGNVKLSEVHDCRHLLIEHFARSYGIRLTSQDQIATPHTVTATKTTPSRVPIVRTQRGSFPKRFTYSSRPPAASASACAIHASRVMRPLKLR
jgi:hypothetical protein